MDWEGVTLRVEGADAVTVAGAGLRLGTAAGDLTLPLLTAEIANAQRANVAQVPGAARFDTGEPGGSTSIITTLPDGSGSYALRLIPAVGATMGQPLTVQVDIGPVTLTKDGWIARPLWLPLIMR